MRIDFHIHAFPDKVAHKAINGLMATVKRINEDTSGLPYTDGTEAGAREKLSEYADIGVMMPIATRAGQQRKVNDWAKSVSHGNIMSFGSVFPFDDDALCEMERIKSLGLYGIKLHPDYQGFDICDERVFGIYEKAEELGLPVLFHAGLDPVSIDHIHCRPSGIRRVAERFSGLTVIAAHMGGAYLYEEAKSELYCAELKNLYIDCSLSGFFISREEFITGVRTIGADKVLFATDMPWSNGTEAVNNLDSCGFSEDELDMIYFKNAEKLLHISEDEQCWKR